MRFQISDSYVSLGSTFSHLMSKSGLEISLYSREPRMIAGSSVSSKLGAELT